MLQSKYAEGKTLEARKRLVQTRTSSTPEQKQQIKRKGDMITSTVWEMTELKCIITMERINQLVIMWFYCNKKMHSTILCHLSNLIYSSVLIETQQDASGKIISIHQRPFVSGTHFIFHLKII